MDTSSLMTESEVKAVRAIVDYLYADEKADYESYVDDSPQQDAHIFTSVLALKEWLTKNYGKAN